MSCKFEDVCSNNNIECEFCQYNPDACLQDCFNWDGTEKEPTQEELDSEIYG